MQIAIQPADFAFRRHFFSPTIGKKILTLAHTHYTDEYSINNMEWKRAVGLRHSIGASKRGEQTFCFRSLTLEAHL
ncbi:MAG: hypothetical protein EXR98_18505 [Gemmataceae bacterium]|nr:hypothetical protein [Gemmataceae bacterium]